MVTLQQDITTTTECPDSEDEDNDISSDEPYEIHPLDVIVCSSSREEEYFMAEQKVKRQERLKAWWKEIFGCESIFGYELMYPDETPEPDLLDKFNIVATDVVIHRIKNLKHSCGECNCDDVQTFQCLMCNSSNNKKCFGYTDVGANRCVCWKCSDVF